MLYGRRLDQSLQHVDGSRYALVHAVAKRARQRGRDLFARGFFGFFECVDDHDVAMALFSTAEAWLKERGQLIMLKYLVDGRPE